MQHANDNGAHALAGALTFASFCSGIEAASVAFTPLGWRAVCFSEIEKFPSAVLAHHYPDVPNLGDFTKIDTKTLPRVDILCGGTPCQAFSVAGLRGSLDDARGNLSLEFVRLAHELADGNKLRNVIWENVPGVLSTKDNAFGCFLAGLVGADYPLVSTYKRGRWPNAGMVAGPKGRAAWAIKDAQFFGLAQRRKRVIVVADFGNGADPAAVLFEPEGLRRNSPPSREAGQGVAISPSLRARANSSHRLDSQAYVPDIARCVATREGSSQDYESTTMVAVGVTGPISHALKAEGADASEDGTGRGTPIVCVHGTQDPCTSKTTAFSLGRNNGGENAVLTVALRGREGGATAELGGEVATALRASSGGGDKPHVLAFQNHGSNVEVCGDVTGTLPTNCDRASGGAPMVATSAVRRLTPRECERLQGFPDDYTAIPWRGKPADQCPDGPRYKALGNSWAVPLFSWLGKRIQQHMPPTAANDNNTELRDAA